MFAPRADDLGLDAGVIHLHTASVNSTDGISYKAKVLHRKVCGATPPSLKYLADAIYFGESLSYMAQRFFLCAFIIELN
jgi:hypothetical protein